MLYCVRFLLVAEKLQYAQLTITLHELLQQGTNQYSGIEISSLAV